MHQIVLHKFPGAYAKYRFKCRNNINLVPYKDEIEKEFDHLCTLQLNESEIQYLRTLPFLTDDYVDFMEDYRPKRRFIHVDITDGVLDIWFDGPILQTMPFEIWVLRIVNEVYFRNIMRNSMLVYGNGTTRLYDKILTLNNYMNENTTNVFKLVDFGTRRSFSGAWHKTVTNILKNNLTKDVFVGTSNVLLAKELNLTPIGTFAHEYVQIFQGLGICPIEDSQKVALQTWADEYRGELGICLSDTLGLNKFLKDFDLYFAKLYDGVRHDSGDPFYFADAIIEHYNNLGIDPKTKSIVFSDGLDVELAIEIAEHCKNRINVSFGIGTNLTNDLGYEPLQIVIKMVECGITKDDMRPVAKLSDSPGKTMCENDVYINYLKDAIK